MFSQIPQANHSNPAKYKTVLCKHYNSAKGCSFGDKCQFAHGQGELRNQGGAQPMMGNMIRNQPRKGPNPQNYKIVKCKYFERDGTCRYGTLCSFAHGDSELRKKSDNMNQGIPDGMGMMMDPMWNMKNPYMQPQFDPNMMMPMMQGMQGMQGMNAMNGIPPIQGMPGVNPEGMGMDMFMGMNFGMNMPKGQTAPTEEDSEKGKMDLKNEDK